jgi:hypothetical protein
VQVDRDKFAEDLKKTKLKFGRAWLQSLRGISYKIGPAPADAREEFRPSVLIRYGGHGPDYALVKQIEGIFEECTGWHPVVDGKNDPLLRPDARFKVVFETSGPCLAQRVAQAFHQGELLSVSVGECSVEPPSNPALS